MTGHAYTLLAVAQVADSAGNRFNLVKLRNPWGKGEWTGDWGDKSPLWNDELKHQLHFVDQDDGVFWMDFADFQRIFGNWSVNKYVDGFKYSHSLLSS